MTIWLLTLPEKFKEWFEYHKTSNIDDLDGKTIMSLTDIPFFPQFMSENHHPCTQCK